MKKLAGAVLAVLMFGCSQPKAPVAAATDQAVVGGSAVENDSVLLKWTVSIQLLAAPGHVFPNTRNGEKAHRCSGVILNRKLILTAAHCVLNLPGQDLAEGIEPAHRLRIAFGPDGNTINMDRWRAVKAMYVSPRYQQLVNGCKYAPSREACRGGFLGTARSDLAVLELMNTIPRGFEAPELNFDPEFKVGDEVGAVGFGYREERYSDDIKMEDRTGIPKSAVQDVEEGAQELSVARVADFNTISVWFAADQHPAPGDSGGPVVHWDGRTAKVIGVVSAGRLDLWHGKESNEPRYHEVTADLGSDREFIEGLMARVH